MAQGLCSCLCRPVAAVKACVAAAVFFRAAAAPQRHAPRAPCDWGWEEQRAQGGVGTLTIVLFLLGGRG